MPYTPEQVRAALELILAVGDVIRDAKRLPSGELYARLCGKLTLAQYQQIIDRLVECGVVKVVAHELIWIGPPKPQEVAVQG